MGEDDSSPMTILFLVVLVDMLGFTLVIPFLTYFIQDLASAEGITDLGRRDFWVGFVIAVYSLAQFLFTPILGSLSDRFGRRPILMFGLMSNTIFFIAFGLSGSLLMAIVARFFAGAGNGNIAVAKAYIGDISEPELIPRRMGMIGAAFGLGFMIGPFVGGVLSDPANGIGGAFETSFWQDYPYLLPCLVSSLMSLLSLILAYFRLPESLSEPVKPISKRSPTEQLIQSISIISSTLKLPKISSLIVVNFLFMLGFTMMHGTFILFTSMDPDNGGLGWSEMDNGWIFAFIGFIGVIVQGGLIGPLSERFSMQKMMMVGTLLTGIGVASIPYAPAGIAWLIFGSSAGIAIGNGLYSPTQSSILTFEIKSANYELGQVMGAQEGSASLARIIGPLLAAYIWSITVEGTGLWTYHTCFRVSGIFFFIALLLQFNMRSSTMEKAQG